MGAPCSSDADCGTDKTMCCAGHPDGTMSAKQIPLGEKYSTISVTGNAAFCNKKPASDGGPGAEDITNYIVKTGDYGPKIGVKFDYTFPKEKVYCLEEQVPPPNPQPPAPTPNNDTKVGTPCKESKDCTGGDSSLLSADDDDTPKYCCGTATKGTLVPAAGKSATNTDVENTIVCGMTDGNWGDAKNF